MRKLLETNFPDYPIKFDEPLRNYTYTKLGGNAEFFFSPANLDQLSDLYSFANANDIPVFILGNGSNLIIRDGGIRGIVISTEKLNEISVDGDTVIAGCGSKIIDVSFFAADESLTGLEFACGIPGSTGGAVYMNAGAYEGETNDVIHLVKAMNQEGQVVEMHPDELKLSYRTSVFQELGWIILEAYFKLSKGDPEAIKNKMEHLNYLRNKSQPLEYPSCGSVFKRPPGYYAGKLIRESGLQGHSIGGAQVSTKHSGFIVNKDESTSDEYIGLIQHIQKTVKSKFGVDLETEVRILGEY